MTGAGSEAIDLADAIEILFGACTVPADWKPSDKTSADLTILNPLGLNKAWNKVCALVDKLRPTYPRAACRRPGCRLHAGR